MKEWPSLIGQRFGKLVVTEQAESTEKGQRRWVCQCDCGSQRVVLGSNLKRGTTVSCGCKKYKDLTGQHIGSLTVLERSDLYGTRGKRRVQLWKCQCDCGAITYKATDTLTNDDANMCQDCAGKYAASRAREKAGFTGGTQIAKIKDITRASDNATGVRGVYFDGKSGKYRARIRFQGKLYSLGAYMKLEDAIEARRLGEEEFFGTFLELYEKDL